MSPSSSTRPDGAGRKKRARPLPHVNARNLAIEKKRREQMNGNFLDLAYLVPSLANTQRLTKVQIVNQTIEHLREQQELCATAAGEMQELLAENYRLAAQVNVLRSAVRGPAPPPEQGLPLPGTLAQLVAISQLGRGTATLRDANEGPEPKSKVSPVATEAAPASQPHAAGPLPAAQSDDNAVPPYGGMWNTGYSYASLPTPHQNQYVWPSQRLHAPVGSSPPPTVPAMPTPPEEILDNDVLADFVYYTNAMTTNNGSGSRFEGLNVDIPWPGIGIC
ncbi:hypothetical protein PWT90_01337 [Aphanocladium album]|nr:hypothetical protein PWT90_01337 [Aphanocladium album]